MKTSLVVLLLLPLCISLAPFAQASEKEALTRAQTSHLQAFYEDLHRNPEISGEETRTAAKVAEEFRALGLETQDHIGGTGVVGVLKNGEGPVTLIRAELDGLPVIEATGAPYSSQAKGKMHACGHDFHETILLGAATEMMQVKSEWKGTLIFLAQPAEERIFGANAMIKDGLFKKIPKPDVFLALHTTGSYPRGKLILTSGFAMANADTIDITFRGKGAHGSKPEAGIDPIIEAAEFILKTQTIIGREKQAIKPAVLGVGSIHGGTRGNIIPDEVKLQATLRTYDQDLRKHLKQRVVETAEGIAKTDGAPAPTVDFVEATDATYNDPALTARMRKVLQSTFGSDAVLEGEQNMGSEDFGEFGLAIHSPSLFIFLGEQDPKDKSVTNHSAKYLPDFSKTFSVGVKATVAEILELNKR